LGFFFFFFFFCVALMAHGLGGKRGRQDSQDCEGQNPIRKGQQGKKVKSSERRVQNSWAT
jgi:hypothetical protein